MVCTLSIAITHCPVSTQWHMYVRMYFCKEKPNVAQCMCDMSTVPYVVCYNYRLLCHWRVLMPPYMVLGMCGCYVMWCDCWLK